MERITSTFIALCIALGVLFMGTTPAFASSEDISGKFTDPVFLAIVYAALGKKQGQPITANECARVTELDANVPEYGMPTIKNLAGVEYFTNLERLYCIGNELTSLNISKNKKLRVLLCSYNLITNLDVSKNLSLEILDTFSCPLKKLNVSKNRELRELTVFDNNLRKLNLMNNTKLTHLYVSENRLWKLNLTQNTKMKLLYCSGNYFTGENKIKGSSKLNLGDYFVFEPQNDPPLFERILYYVCFGWIWM